MMRALQRGGSWVTEETRPATHPEFRRKHGVGRQRVTNIELSGLALSG